MKRLKTGKEKKRKHKMEKLKDEEVESSEDYDRQIPMGELDDQEFSSRGGNKRKVVDGKISVESIKKKRPLEDPFNYRERSSRSSLKAGGSEGERSREGSQWKPSIASESHKQSDTPSDRYREDRHGSGRKSKSYLMDEEYTRRGRDRERDRLTDGGTDYRKRKR